MVIEQMGGTVKAARTITKLPGGEKMMGMAIFSSFKKLANEEHGTMHFLEDNMQDRIEVYWGGMDEWQALPDKYSDMKHFKDWNKVVPIDHGYDETKPEEELDLDDMKKAAEFRGGNVTLSKSVKRAWLYATALGVYEPYIDGSRIGDAHFAPGWADYKKRLQYQTMDVTENLKNRAEHRLEILVGNGWYKGILGFDVKPNRYGDRTAAFAELRIEYTDGTRETIATDSTWGVATGEIRMSELYMGETINTWNPACTFGSIKIVPFDNAVLTVQEDEPVRITDRLPVQKIFTAPNGDLVADFGQNLTGAVELHIKG